VRWKQKKRISYIPSCEEELTTRPLAKKGPKESVPPSSTSSSWATGIRSGRASYSPEDWERLVELKDRYDPNNLFRFNRNILPSSVLE
jgi:hypothetical protein